MSVFRLRCLTGDESELLNSKLRRKTLPVRVWQRYRVIDQARHGFKARQIADRVGCDLSVVYDWIHRFNESGFGDFERPPNPKGRPPIVTSQQVRQLVKIALSRPEDLGLPFSQWSVAKLHEYCRRRRLLPPVTDEWVRRLLRREGLSLQRTKTWKQSDDPDFEVKKTTS